MPALEDPPVSTARLFEPVPARTLADLLGEIDDASRHGQPAPCLVCGAAMSGGDLGTPAECPACGSTLE